MKLTYKQSDSDPSSSFYVRQDLIPCIEQNWHFHKEIELIYFLKSNGTRYVGNSIGDFGPGELYLIGSNVPHLFINHKEYYSDTSKDKAVDLVVIKFDINFFGSDFLELPEIKKLKSFLKSSERGIKFSKSTAYLIHNQIVGLVSSKGLCRVVGLLNILNVLSVSENCMFLCSEIINNTFNTTEKERMANVITFISENFHKRIELKEVAEIAFMTPNSFCRYFKKHTKKSFTQFLNEVRIKHACRQLIEGETPINSICFQSGFNTLTNFNKQFKAFMKVTPSEYMNQHSREISVV